MFFGPIPRYSKLLFPKAFRGIRPVVSVDTYLKNKYALGVARRFSDSITELVVSFGTNTTQDVVPKDLSILKSDIESLVQKTLILIENEPANFKKAVGILILAGEFPTVRSNVLHHFNMPLRRGVLQAFGVNHALFQTHRQTAVNIHQAKT